MVTVAEPDLTSGIVLMLPSCIISNVCGKKPMRPPWARGLHAPLANASSMTHLYVDYVITTSDALEPVKHFPFLPQSDVARSRL